MNSLLHSDVIIIGAGLAGLTAAWHLRDRSIAIVRPRQNNAASYMARGGIAAAIGENDGPQRHVEDTVRAGGSLVDRNIAGVLASDGLERMIDLFELSIDFDRDDQGCLHLGREAMHSRNRIVHAAGDQTGREVTTAVRRELDRRDDVTFVDGRALELIAANGRVFGVVASATGNEPQVLVAPTTVLATGGIGGLFQYTTNPLASRGEGIAMAARAGATLVDLEFVQFHPTALATKARPLPLLSEAIRGQGATLVDESGHSLMANEPQGDLAGRDRVSRVLWEQIQRGKTVFLDARSIDDFAHQFPAAHAACTAAGLDPTIDFLPVTPAAHYHMGGIATDASGATSVDGLWAVGEVASTGAHGANRLASNSLIEAMVFGTRAAYAIGELSRTLHPIPIDEIIRLRRGWARGLNNARPPEPIMEAVTRIMWENAGIERNEPGLVDALHRLQDMMITIDHHHPVRLAIECARAIVSAALRRTESRGAHYRVDFPKADTSFETRLFTSGS